jgi:DivIVA domain-containing protein
MLTPADIDKIQFSTTRLKEGYDQNEVDAFLDRLSVDYARGCADLARAEQEITRLRSQISRLTEAPTAVAATTPVATADRLLRVAEQTAEQHVAEARAEADEIVRRAGGQGARAIEEAQAAADQMVRDAKEQAEQIINDGYAEKAQRFGDLEARHQQVQSALRQLEEQGKKTREALNYALLAYDRDVQ